MLNNLLPFVYAISLVFLLWQAIRVMSRGLFTTESSLNKVRDSTKNPNQDRTGQVTIHPEILNQDGNITDEDLLTVRFSKDIDPPQSSDKTAQ